MMKLYYVKARVPEFDGRKNVLFIFFKCSPAREPPRYAELIKDYKIGGWAEGFIDELFTEDEARRVKAHIDELFTKDAQAQGCVHNPDTTTLDEIELPVRNDMMGVSAFSVRNVDFLYEQPKPNYPMPFKIETYFVCALELVDGPDEPDGEMWVQTNEEAVAAAITDDPAPF